MTEESEREFLKAAAPDLQAYLLSKELYWPLSLQTGGKDAVRTPQLTLGNLLLSMAALKAAPQGEEINALFESVQKVRAEWRSNWSRKAAHEFSARLRLWQDYLRELRSDPSKNAAAFAYELRQRAILHLLQAEILAGDVDAAHEESLKMLDQILRGLTHPGPFIWESEMSPAFDAETYWFLYRALSQKA